METIDIAENEIDEEEVVDIFSLLESDIDDFGEGYGLKKIPQAKNEKWRAWVYTTKEVSAKKEWKKDALCQEFNKHHDIFFEKENIDKAVSVCRRCPVQVDCLMFAMRFSMFDGVFGGITPRGRRFLDSLVFQNAKLDPVVALKICRRFTNSIKETEHSNPFFSYT